MKNNFFCELQNEHIVYKMLCYNITEACFKKNFLTFPKIT